MSYAIKNKIHTYLVQNDYSGKGLPEFLQEHSNNKRYKTVWLASDTSFRSGIIRYKGMKIYFNCIKPWAMCPSGQVEIEEVA